MKRQRSTFKHVDEDEFKRIRELVKSANNPKGWSVTKVAQLTNRSLTTIGFISVCNTEEVAEYRAIVQAKHDKRKEASLPAMIEKAQEAMSETAPEEINQTEVVTLLKEIRNELKMLNQVWQPERERVEA